MVFETVGTSRGSQFHCEQSHEIDVVVLSSERSQRRVLTRGGLSKKSPQKERPELPPPFNYLLGKIKIVDNGILLPVLYCRAVECLLRPAAT